MGNKELIIPASWLNSKQRELLEQLRGLRTAERISEKAAGNNGGNTTYIDSFPGGAFRVTYHGDSIEYSIRAGNNKNFKRINLNK